MARITLAMLDEMRRLEAEGTPQRKIAVIVGCSRGSVGDFLTGKRTPLETKAKVKASPERTKLGTCPDCGVEATKFYPLHLNRDGKHRCVVCAGQWEVRWELRRQRRTRGESK